MSKHVLVVVSPWNPPSPNTIVRLAGSYLPKWNIQLLHREGRQMLMMAPSPTGSFHVRGKVSALNTRPDGTRNWKAPPPEVWLLHQYDSGGS